MLLTKLDREVTYNHLHHHLGFSFIPIFYIFFTDKSIDVPKFSSNGIITASLNDIMKDFESLIIRARSEDSALPVVPAPGDGLSVEFVTNKTFRSNFNILKQI